MKVVSVLKQIVRKGAMTVTNYSPELLMGVGTAAFVGTIFMAVKVSPIVEERLDEAIVDSERRNMTKPRQIAYVAGKVAPIVAPTVIMGGASLACFFGAHRIQVKRQVALASLYSMASQTLNSYQDKIIEEFGDEEHKSILERVFKNEDVPELKDPEEYEGEGPVMVYDRVTNRYFKSTPEKIQAAEGRVNSRLMDEVIVPLNYFYDELDLDDNSFIGEAIGWDADRCRPNVMFYATLDDDKRPLLMISYDTRVIDENALRTR